MVQPASTVQLSLEDELGYQTTATAAATWSMVLRAIHQQAEQSEFAMPGVDLGYVADTLCKAVQQVPSTYLAAQASATADLPGLSSSTYMLHVHCI